MPVQSFTKSLAVAIGIDVYDQGIRRLSTAVNDATQLAELLCAEHGYEAILLTEANTGHPVTTESLAAVFTESLPARLGPDDRLLVYFAGHGVAVDAADGPAGYILLQDARPNDRSTFLSMKDLHAWLAVLPCRHMLAVLDCCFAGAFRWASTRSMRPVAGVLHRERFDRYIRSPAWQVITSASCDQRALDILTGSVAGSVGVRGEAGRRHSPFAEALFAGLEGAADLFPAGGDGVITATELAVYLRETVEVAAADRASTEQTPQLWPLAKHRGGEFIFLTPGQPVRLPHAEALTERNNPYRGLRAYEREHDGLFFGRREEIAELVKRVDDNPCVVVLGASGTGKSSLVSAGLLPALEKAGPQWHVLPPMRPTEHPSVALAALLHANLPGVTFEQSAVGGLAATIAEWQAANPGRRLVLTVDQCEELITVCRDEQDRDRFLGLLAVAIQQQAEVLRLILTLRTDFEPQLADKALFARQAAQANRYVVPAMDQDALRDVIEGPAAVRELYFEPPELVDELINEVAQMPGALPLLSFTLSEMYIRYVRSGRDNRALTPADYPAGGVIGSLQERANEEYEGLPDDSHRATMQRVILRMIAAEGGELARRRVPLSELDYPADEENVRVETVLDRLVEARLVVRGTMDNPDGSRGEPYAEPAHDALMAAWGRLLQWKQDAEEYLPLQRRVSQAGMEWQRAPAKERDGLLWNDDPRLPLLERTLAPKSKRKPGALARLRRALWPDVSAPRDTAWMNRLEVAFTQASVQRRAAVLKRVVGITAAVIVVLSGLSVFAARQAKSATVQRNAAQTQRNIALTREVEAQTAATAEAQARQVAQTREVEAKLAATAEAQARQRAEQQRLLALGRQLAAQSINAVDRELDSELSLLLAVQAVRAYQTAGQEPSSLLDQALRRVLTAAPRAIVRFTPRVSAPDPEDRLLQSLWPEVTVALSPSGRLALIRGLCEGSNCADLVVVEPLAGKELVRVTHPENEQTKKIIDFRVSPDDKILAFTDGRGIITLVGLDDGRMLSSYPSQVHAFSAPSNALALVGEDGGVKVIDLTAPDPTPVHLEGVPASTGLDLEGAAPLLFRPDGKQLTVIGSDGLVWLWTLGSGSSRLLDAGGAAIKEVVFSDDGRYLGGRGNAKSGDGYVAVWDSESGKRVMDHAYNWVVTHVALSSTGRWLAVDVFVN